MDLTSQKTIKELFKRHETRPWKGLGQNFLTSKGALADILKAAQLTKENTVLEIGPGIGTLTRGLAQSAKRVIAVEKDSAMVEIFKETTHDLPNIEIVCADILKLGETKEFLNLSKETNAESYKLQANSYKLVANLPYYITSPVIRLFLEAKHKPSLMVLMVQKEVAQRICAKPPAMSLLAVSVQIYGKPSIVSYVKKNCFWPQPKVDSAILRIAPLINADKKLIDADIFFKIAKAGFKQPRKQLLNNFANMLDMLDVERLTRLTSAEKRQAIERWLKKNGIEPSQRAETLSVEDWIKLAKDYTIYE